MNGNKNTSCPSHRPIIPLPTMLYRTLVIARVSYVYGYARTHSLIMYDYLSWVTTCRYWMNCFVELLRSLRVVLSRIVQLSLPSLDMVFTTVVWTPFWVEMHSFAVHDMQLLISLLMISRYVDSQISIHSLELRCCLCLSCCLLERVFSAALFVVIWNWSACWFHHHHHHQQRISSRRKSYKNFRAAEDRYRQGCRATKIANNINKGYEIRDNRL